VPRWVLLEYNPFRFGPSGFAPWLVRDVARLQRRLQAALAVMVHESWIEMKNLKSTAIGLWQRAQFRTVLRYADAVMTSTEGLAREIGTGAVHVPVPVIINPVPSSHTAACEGLGLDGMLTVALFTKESRVADSAVMTRPGRVTASAGGHYQTATRAAATSSGSSEPMISVRLRL